MADTTDPAASALDEIRGRGYRKGTAPGLRAGQLADHAADDIPRLLAAVEAALNHHQSVKYGVGTVCQRDRSSWPCPEVAAITAALTENDSAPAGAAREDGGP